jgi:hypothetical protein
MLIRDAPLLVTVGNSFLLYPSAHYSHWRYYAVCPQWWLIPGKGLCVKRLNKNHGFGFKVGQIFVRSIVVVGNEAGTTCQPRVHAHHAGNEDENISPAIVSLR